jgi:hypothetical protein
MSTRTPDQILEQFGRELKAARPRRRRRLWLAATLATTVVVGVPAALATRPMWQPDAAQPAGAPKPERISATTTLATGEGWTLTAATCTFKDHATVVLYLTTPTGGAGRRCDALTPEAARGPVAPPTLYLDPNTHKGLLFGAMPAHITHAEAVLHRAGRGRSEVRPIRLRHTAFVLPIPAGTRVLNVIGLDANGEPRLHCDARACQESP